MAIKIPTYTALIDNGQPNREGKQYYWGLDLGSSEGDMGVRCECHEDTEGVLIVDRIVAMSPSATERFVQRSK
jgi:hypothetical protein